MKEFFLLLVILNPFAQVLYLQELMHRLSRRDFTFVHMRASLISLTIFLVFAFGGDFLLKYVFQVRLPAVQVFGGLIIVMIAFRYVVEGPGSNLLFRGDISELAPNISLPYMVGPGTLWVSMIAGRAHTFPIAASIIAAVLLINFVFLIIIKVVTDLASTKAELGLDKYFAIFMRVNALFIGAIGIEMIFTGIESLFDSDKTIWLLQLVA